MKDLKNYCLVEIETIDAANINGGGYGYGGPRIVIEKEYYYGPSSGTGFESDRSPDWVDFKFVEGSFY